MNCSEKSRESGKGNTGFGLVEVLVTMGILGIGILGVASLHTAILRQGWDNRARAEALAIAQSRIEVMRNYTAIANTLTEFNSRFPDMTHGNSTVVTGANTRFTRTETITTSGNIKDITVSVDWTAPFNGAQNINLKSKISYIAPRRSGDSAMETDAVKSVAPAGRARLGGGTLTGEQSDAVADNGDGTGQLVTGTDRLLVVESEVVLTLVQACQGEKDECAGFARINGRVWIDQATAGDIIPGDVHIAASGAAYCARHFTRGTTTIPVANNTASTLMSASGDYEHFDYTCYLGGGWHGNIGILYGTDLGKTGSFCVGDPTAVIDGNKPSIAARRAYRGMLFKIDSGEEDDKEKIPGTDETRYYSHGIGDGVELPVPGDATHDFILTANAGATSCMETIMTRPDSKSGSIFSGVPNDFFCLNDGLLATYDTVEYGHETFCPYDPTFPPTASHVITGTINIDGNDTHDNDELVAGTIIYTSDSADNCTHMDYTHSVETYTSAFSCNVFRHGDGWTGVIGLLNSSLECAEHTLAFNDLGHDDETGNDFYCAIRALQ